MADDKFDPLNPVRVAEVDRVVSRALKPRSPVSYQIHKTDETKTIEAAVDVKRQAEAIDLVKREGEIRRAADKVVAAQAKEDLKRIEVAEKASAARNKFLLSNKQLKNWEWEVLINRVSTISLGLGPVRFIAPLEYKAANAQDVVDASRSNDRIVDGTPTPSITRPSDAGGPFSWREGTEFDPQLAGDTYVGEPRTHAEEEQVKAAEAARLEAQRMAEAGQAGRRIPGRDPRFQSGVDPQFQNDPRYQNDVPYDEKALLERDRLQNRERAQDYPYDTPLNETEARARAREKGVPYDPTFAYPPVVLDRNMTPAERKAAKTKAKAAARKAEARRIASKKK